MVLDRINNAELRTVSFYENEPREIIVDGQKESEVGYIDYTDNRDKDHVHKFALIIARDWEFLDSEKHINSQVQSLRCLLQKSLIEDIPVNLLIKKRKIENNFYDFLIKVNNLQL
jgi:hypothetical protein